MTIGSLIFLAIGTILALLYIIVLLVASPKYAVYIQNLTDKEHIFKPLYVVGFFVLDKTHYKFGLKLDKQRFISFSPMVIDVSERTGLDLLG